MSHKFLSPLCKGIHRKWHKKAGHIFVYPLLPSCPKSCPPPVHSNYIRCRNSKRIVEGMEGKELRNCVKVWLRNQQQIGQRGKGTWGLNINTNKWKASWGLAKTHQPLTPSCPFVSRGRKSLCSNHVAELWLWLLFWPTHECDWTITRWVHVAGPPAANLPLSSSTRCFPEYIFMII